MILKEIAEYARIRVEADKKRKSFETVKEEALCLPKGEFIFEKTLKVSEKAIICEVKKASPSKGIIALNFPYVQIAKSYVAAGASCISVLTEPKWFLGSDAIFREIRNNILIPMLRKDFTIDAYQIYQAKVLGADAILLICALLDTETIKQYIAICDSLGISALVETHDSEEIHSAIAAGARIIGVNNRNLKDFSVDLSTASNLKKWVPENIIFVAESGILSPADGIALFKEGANALLIGEALMKREDKEGFLREIRGSKG